jgi:hypothetical protein
MKDLMKLIDCPHSCPGAWEGVSQNPTVAQHTKTTKEAATAGVLC